MAKRYYSSWINMKTRCNNPNSTNYHRWGGRGISYDKKWETFAGFEEDMDETYKEGLQLDRIDNDKNYSKENCRWVNQTDQNNNRSDNRLFEHLGLKKTLTQWSKILSIKRSTLAQRYYVYNWDIDKCLSIKAKVL